MSNEFETVTLNRAVLSRLGVFYRVLDGRDGFANAHWSSLGLEYADMTSDRWLEHVHPSDREHARSVVDRHLRGETDRVRIEYRVLGSDGNYHWFISSGIVESRDSAGGPLTYIGHDEDITDLHVLRQELLDARQVAEDRAAEAEALRAAGAVVVASLDAPTAVRSVTEQLHSLVPFDFALVCEIDNRELIFAGGSDGVTSQTWREFTQRHTKALLKVITTRIPDLISNLDGPAGHALLVPLVVRGSTVGVLALARDENEFAGEDVRVSMAMADFLGLALSNARLYSRMQQRAEIDQLSGVFTRRAFMESGEQVMDESFHSRRPLCCIILDLDHFKSINDTFGHPVGDQVIRTLGSIMRDSLRSTDFIGRFGGEEFCALLTDTSLGDGVEVAERLRASIGSAVFPEIDRSITASIGICAVTHASSESEATVRLSVEQMVKRADVALYKAKSNGRNRVVAYSTDMEDA